MTCTHMQLRTTIYMLYQVIFSIHSIDKSMRRQWPLSRSSWHLDLPSILQKDSINNSREVFQIITMLCNSFNFSLIIFQTHLSFSVIRSFCQICHKCIMVEKNKGKKHTSGRTWTLSPRTVCSAHFFPSCLTPGITNYFCQNYFLKRDISNYPAYLLLHRNGAQDIELSFIVKINNVSKPVTVAEWVVHQTAEQEVSSSNPSIPPLLKHAHGEGKWLLY